MPPAGTHGSEDKLTTDVWQIDYQFSGTYTDPVLNLAFPVTIVITLSRVANGTSFVVARAYATGGSQFKNHSPSSLSVKAELIRGTTKDTTNLDYQWKKSINGTVWEDIAGATAATLAVTPSMVDSFAMFKCSILDTDATSDTFNISYDTEAVSILDVTDPYQAVIESTAEAISRTTREAPPSSAAYIRTARRLTDRGEPHLHMDQDRQGRNSGGVHPHGGCPCSIVTTRRRPSPSRTMM